MIVNNINEEILERIEDIEKKSFSSPWDKEVYRALFERENSILFLWYENEEIVAFAMLLDMVDVYEVLKIAVEPRKRNMNIGSKLVEEIKESLHKDIYLEVRINNIKAINLYEKSGFTKIGKRKAYYQDTKEDALIYLLKRVI